MKAAKKSVQETVASDQQKPDQVRVEEIAVEKLLVSQQETRKTVDQVALKELAASIALKGVQEPLMVRLLRADVHGTFYEIVAGQRRHAASQIAGKATCPCIVREMSDAEAAELRIISNLQREDLPPLEEALAFSALLCAPGATVETVAAKLAKAPSYVCRRLKLLDAVEPVREALRAGAIEVGHALELARLDEKQQIRHLSRLNCGYVCSTSEANQFDGDSEGDEYGEYDEDGEDVFVEDEDDDPSESPQSADVKRSQWRRTDASVAGLRKEIARTTLRVLADAPFPLDDELPPMACTECPKRSGNAALLFDDCAQDTCTDRDCFDEKVEVWIKHELAQADKDKRKLLMLSDGYSSSPAVIESYDVVLVDRQKPVVPCESQEEAIWVTGKNAGHRTIICRSPTCKQHKSRNTFSSAPKDPAKAKAERKKLLAKVKAEKAYRAVLFNTIAAVPGPALQKAFDRIVTELANYAVRRSDSTKYGVLGEATGIPKEALTGWKTENSFAELAKRPPHVRALIGWLAIHDGELTVHESDVPGGGALNKARKIDLEEIAEVVGVDWKSLRAAHEPVAEKATPAKKKPAKKTPVKAAPKKAAKKATRKAAGKGARR